MGLEFLRDYGGRRVRAFPDQPELDLPEEEREEDETPGDEGVDPDYETGGESWRPIAVEEAPRRLG